jgi:cell division septation protein DedD
MAFGGKKSGGDFVLESRHLVGLFLLLVVIFGVVFTLGYLMGRGQFDARLRTAVNNSAEAAPSRVTPAPRAQESRETEKPVTAQGGSDWDFYHSSEPKTDEDHLQPPKKSLPAPSAAKSSAAKPSAVVSKPPANGTSAPPLNAPLIPRGAIMLQVAAIVSQSDALALAQALQQKRFPAFVIPPGGDKFYRVQVGPYADKESATIARKDLEAKGFKSIVKR